MIKQMAWNTFKNTGNIDTFMELIQLESVEKELNKDKLNDNIQVNDYGELKDQGNNIIVK